MLTVPWILWMTGSVHVKCVSSSCITEGSWSWSLYCFTHKVETLCLCCVCVCWWLCVCWCVHVNICVRACLCCFTGGFYLCTKSAREQSFIEVLRHCNIGFTRLVNPHHYHIHVRLQSDPAKFWVWVWGVGELAFLHINTMLMPPWFQIKLIQP